MTDDLTSKLAVLLHADVVGSTELVRLNDGLTHQRIVHAFRQFSETISSHDGVVLGVWGDALVAEFPKTSDAIGASLALPADACAARCGSRLQPNRLWLPTVIARCAKRRCGWYL